MLPLLIAGARAQAPPAPTEDERKTTLSVNETFQVKYWRSAVDLADPPDGDVLDYVEQIDRVIPSVTSGPWTVAVQVDQVALFMNRYYLGSTPEAGDEELVIEHDLVPDGMPNVFPRRFDAYLTPEKVRVQVDGKAGTLVLGDAYAAFGRGIALNLNRNVDIDIDTSVQGAKAVLRPGAWDVTLVAGQANRQQVTMELPNLELPRELRHLVAGARVERFGLGPANLGAHGVIYDFVDEPGLVASFEQYAGPDALVGGATAELVGVGGMDLYVEGDLFGFGPDLGSPLGPRASDLGYGVYASVSAYPGPIVLLVEGKRYSQAERVNTRVGGPELYEVAVAPSLEYERAIVPDTSEALNSQDIWGTRVEASWAAIPGELSPYVAAALFRDDDLHLHNNTVPETIVHPMAGVEWIRDEVGLLANAGYRQDQRDGDADGADRLVHGDLSLNFPLPGELVGYVALAGLRFDGATNSIGIDPDAFLQAETAYGLTWDGKLTGTFSLDTTTDEALLTERAGNLTESLFGGFELQYKPSPDLTLKAFYGAQKAGIRCAGGQCRQLPGFDGAKFSLTGTF